MDKIDKTALETIFYSSPLFKNAKSSTVEYAVKKSILRNAKKGDCLSYGDEGLFIILEGSATVTGRSKTNTVILNTLKKGRVFGMASLFGQRCDTTTVVAKENCLYAVITRECVEELMKNDIGFTKNYVCFLSDKIRFLNKKISFFTSGSAERKLAAYILSLPTENNTVKLEMSMSRLASSLDIGRASLYRALDSLEENCFIIRQNNIITIPSYDEFKKIYGETL